MRVLTTFEDSLKSKRNEKSFQQFLLSKNLLYIGTSQNIIRYVMEEPQGGR